MDALSDLISASMLIRTLDVLVIAYLIYRALLLIHGTRAFPMLLGLTLIGAVYLVAKQVGLVTLAWLIDSFLSSIILVIVVIFQDEIRRGLTKVGVQPLLLKHAKTASSLLYEELSLAVARLSKSRLGSIVVLQRDVGLEEFMGEGVQLDAHFSRKLIVSIFSKESPLHDGAVVISGGRIMAAGCVLPLSFNPDLDPNLGTRHRAALGLTERTDAVVIVVSEESGSITLAVDSVLHRNIDPTSLRELLERHMNSLSGKKDPTREVV
jgi:diadenylate cyclase